MKNPLRILLLSIFSAVALAACGDPSTTLVPVAPPVFKLNLPTNNPDPVVTKVSYFGSYTSARVRVSVDEKPASGQVIKLMVDNRNDWRLGSPGGVTYQTVKADASGMFQVATPIQNCVPNLYDPLAITYYIYTSDKMDNVEPVSDPTAQFQGFFQTQRVCKAATP